MKGMCSYRRCEWIPWSRLLFRFTSNGHSMKHWRGQHRDDRQWKGCYLPYRLFSSPEDFSPPVFCGSSGHHLQGQKKTLATPDLAKGEASTWQKQINCFKDPFMLHELFSSNFYHRILQTCLIVNDFYIDGFAGMERHWQRSTGQKSTRRIQEIVQVWVLK